MLLGAAVVRGSAQDAAIQQKIEELSRVMKRLSLLYEQDSLSLLKNSLAMPNLGTSVIIRWMTSSAGRSNWLRYQQLKSPSVSYSTMENVLMAPHCYLGTTQAHGMGRYSSWHQCWVAHRSDCQGSMLSCKQGSSKQDCKVWRALCLSHLFVSDSWNRRQLEPVRHRADSRNW